MEYNTPSSIKNYLPSKKIQLVIAILLFIGLSYLLVPVIVNFIKKKPLAVEPTTDIVISNLVGDPTSRDTDNDGVPDWQEIAIGLNIENPQSNPGVPDLVTLQTIKEKVGTEIFNLELGNVTDTDKVSLTIYDALSSDSIKNNAVSDVGTQLVVEQELVNYIESQKKNIPVYARKDINVTESNLQTNKEYSKQMKSFIAETPATRNAPKLIREYLEGTGTYASVTPILGFLEGRIADLKKTPVPALAVDIHLELLNATQALYTLVSSYNTSLDDPAYSISIISLVQDALIRTTTNLNYLSIYFSVALDKNGYSN